MIRITEENSLSVEINPGDYIWLTYGDRKYKRKVKEIKGHLNNIFVLESGDEVKISEKQIWIPKRKIKSIGICMNNGNGYYDVIKVENEDICNCVKKEIYKFMNEYKFIDVVTKRYPNEELIIVTDQISSINIRYEE